MQGDAVTEPESEIPSPINFEDANQVHDWITNTVQERVWRPRFFATFASALNDHFGDHRIDVVELGSGPGHLARAVLEECNIASYAAVDFSIVMHGRAREHLGGDARRVRFVLKDFRQDDWIDGFSSVDAVLTMQAAHELRHRDRQPKLVQQMHQILKPQGLLLFCDHYYEAGTTKDVGLYLTREEQPEMLRASGFQQVEELLDLGGMVLYRGQKA
jgi:SAM-dependent methyltransferase